VEYFGWKHQCSVLRESIYESHKNLIESAREGIAGGFISSSVADLVLVAGLHDIAAFVENPEGERKQYAVHVLTELFALRNSYEQLACLNASGNPVLTIHKNKGDWEVLPGAEDTDPFIARLRELGKPVEKGIFVSPIYMAGEGNTQPVMSLVLPVYPHEGALTGYLAVECSLAELFDRFALMDTGKETRFRILDATGRTIPPASDADPGHLFNADWIRQGVGASGQDMTPEGLVSHLAVDPWAGMSSKGDLKIHHADDTGMWVLLVHTRAAAFDAIKRTALIGLLPKMAWDSMFAFIISAILAALLARRASIMEELRREEHRYQSLFNSSNDAILLHGFDGDLPGNFTDVNPSACALLEYSRTELLQRTPLDLAPVIEVEFLAEQFSCLAKEGSLLVKMDLVTRSGRRIPVEINAHRFDFDGNPVVVSVARDVTERKRAEEALAARNEEMRALLLAVPDQIIRMNNEGHISVFLDASQQGDRTSNPLLKTQALESIFPENVVPMVKQSHRRAFETLRMQVFEYSSGFGDAQKHYECRTMPVDNGETLNIVRDISQRRKSEEDLRRWAYAVEQSPAGVVIANLEGEIEYINASFSTMIGYILPELRGRMLCDLFVGRGEDSSYKDVWSAVQEGFAWRGELQQARRNGERIWVDSNIFPVRDRDGKVSHYMGMYQDISERKRLLEALQRSRDELETRVAERTTELRSSNESLQREIEDRMRAEEGLKLHAAIFTHSSSAITLLSLEGEFLQQNRAFRSLFGYSDNELNARTGTAVFLEEDLKRILTGVVDRGGLMFETRATARNGVMMDVEISAFTIQDLAGRPMCFVLFITDITERKQVAEQVARLAAFPSESPNPILAVDFEGEITYLNPAVLDLLERLDIATSEVLPPDHRALVVKCLEVRRELRATHAVGDKVFEWHYNPVPLTNTLHLYAFDVTEQARVEQELAEERRNLEVTVEWRTSQLRESLGQLESTNRRLSEANRAKSHFLSSMSHELRTPLNGILGFTDLLREQFFGTLNPKQMEYVKLIDSSAKHLLSLINDLLDIAKIDAGRMEVFAEDNVASDTINAALDMMKAQFQKKELIIDFRCENSALEVCCDARRFRQIMLNLLSNAVKYTPVGGVIAVRLRTAAGGQARIEVEDNGVGIAPQEQTRIFQEFYQSDHVRDEALGGTGIGLALTRRLVEMQAGEIGVTSQLGKGSVFWFTLPLKKDTTVSIVEAPAQEEEQVPAKLVSLVGRRVLVAEDNEVNLAVLTDMLDAQSLIVGIARNGQECIDLASTFRPELILMDIHMPVMDGLEAVRRLRAQKEFAETPIVAITAQAGEASAGKCLAAGCSAFLPKPVQTHELYAIIRRFFSPLA
jgi:PAS domain S-box-containing protein